MLQVKRSTAILVILGVIGLVAMLMGSLLINWPHDAGRSDAPTVEAQSVFSRGMVDVRNRMAMPMPKVPGNVIEIMVDEGDEVKKSDPILRLDDSQARSLVDIAEAELNAAKQKRNLAELLPEERKAKLVQLEKALEIARSDLVKAQLDLSEKERLLKDKLVTEPVVKAARETSKQAQTEVERAQAAVDDFKKTDPTEKQIEEARALYRAAELKLEAARKTLDNFILRAPADGYIEQLQVNVGDSFPPVVTTQPPILFLPKAGLIVRAELEQDRAALVEEGMTVTLQNYGQINAPKWKGVVERKGRFFRKRRSVLLEPEVVNDARVLECIIKVDPEDEKQLRVGQQLRVQIHLNEPAQRPLSQAR